MIRILERYSTEKSAKMQKKNRKQNTSKYYSNLQKLENKIKLTLRFFWVDKIKCQNHKLLYYQYNNISNYENVRSHS